MIEIKLRLAFIGKNLVKFKPTGKDMRSGAPLSAGRCCKGRAQKVKNLNMQKVFQLKIMGVIKE